MRLNDRVRERLKEEKARLKYSERDLAGMARWSQSKVAQKLLGRTPITLDELETLCQTLGLAPTEAVRDRGLEFVAEMTPTEMRLLELIRRLPKPAYDGLLQFLQVHRDDIEPRGATPKREIFGKPRTK